MSPKKSVAKKPGKKPARKPAAKKPAAKKPAAKRATRTVASKTATASVKVDPVVERCRELAGIVETHGLTELVVEIKGATLSFRRGPDASSMVMAPVVSAPVAAAHPISLAPVSLEDEGAAQPIDTSLHAITSPFVGTFYRAAGPETPPYCEVGQRVEKGQVLCIVEAMKLMNEIEADEAGIIEAVLVQNAEPVEYGQKLFQIRP